MTKRFARLAARTAALWILPATVLAAGCREGEAEGNETAAVDASWDPRKVTGVIDASAAEVRAAIQTRLGGERPTPLDEEQWEHTARLYRAYGQGPLWFGQAGLLNDRAGALLKALINAHQDALRV